MLRVLNNKSILWKRWRRKEWVDAFCEASTYWSNSTIPLMEEVRESICQFKERLSLEHCDEGLDGLAHYPYLDHHWAYLHHLQRIELRARLHIKPLGSNHALTFIFFESLKIYYIHRTLRNRNLTIQRYLKMFKNFWWEAYQNQRIKLWLLVVVWTTFMWPMIIDEKSNLSPTIKLTFPRNNDISNDVKWNFAW